MIGEKIHHYKITRLIGEGGMASVYEAMHEKLYSKVAIKVLNPILTANKNIRQRFENEARFMAGLTHPNITRVIDYEERPDLLAIVMELLEGEDLGSHIKKHGAMPLQETIAAFAQVLDAFDYAHLKGIVHRDVKPSNIFLEPANTIKILDFGIAKLLGAAEDMTMTGTQIGTPVYMSPEQVNTDKSLDHRSDIYSLGVTLYYLLKGEPPYDATTNSSFQIYTRIVQEPLPDLEKFPEIDKIIKIATSKDRALRFQSCGEFKKALSEAIQPKETWQQRATPPVDMEKTLIDIPKPDRKEENKPIAGLKPQPPTAEEKPEKKPTGPKPEKKAGEKKKVPANKPPAKKRIKPLTFSGLSIVVIIVVIIFKVYPSLFLQIFWPSEIQRRQEIKKAQGEQYTEKADIADYLRKNNLKGTPTSSGLYYIGQKTVIGLKPRPGQTCKVHYTGTFLDGTKFDSSYDRSEPFTFVLGKGQVIKGWDEGIALMSVGSKGLLIIPYDLAYGSKGAGNTIPAYSTLVYEVELLAVN